MPDLAVIIPHLNDVTRLRRCLNSLAAQCGPLVEVVVVDNGSTCDLTALARDFPWVQLIQDPTPGAGPARNAGVRATTAPGVAFLDCDCVAAPDWVATALRLSRQSAVFGGQVSLFDEPGAGGRMRRTGAQLFERVFAFQNAAYVSANGFCVTANLVTSRAVFEANGPFRAGLSEDVNWCKRARAAGFALHYAPELRVSHPTRGDWAALRRKWMRLVLEQFVEQDRRRGRWACRAALTALSPLKDTLKVLRSRRLASPAERAKCLATLYRLRLLRAVWMGRQAWTGRA